MVSDTTKATMVPEKRIIKIAGRRSKLAVIQSEQVSAMIKANFPGYECTVLALQTLGDQIQSKPLYSFGGKALWTKELEDLLYDEDEEKRIDLIVHSLKDMPTHLPDGFELAAVTKRVDPSDCLVMAANSPYKSLSELPKGSVIGTSSVRRSAQLKRKFPDLIFESVRGNIQTRLNKLDSEENNYSCIILATAGLVRLGLENRITQRFTSDIMYHAVGQGALGIETRTGDTRIKDILDKIADRSSTICCLSERSLMRTLNGGCSVPIGVESEFDEKTSTLVLKGIVVSVDGTEAVEDQISMHINEDKEDAIKAGALLAESLIASGAKKILDDIHLPTS
ncbi:HEL289Wp [Eremothecium sinecaudum]|uniref:Porphobilinogen deaminase n=1 Tax=Eremothecium sinecaudum TaxID=45286 RepID=A0A0X8HT21_9SACH|nr:HEL289Wp [Eremothecium sinecaudum]AMD20992.1 HEL289Wp [Eremothecium sinecaudum]